MKKNKSKKQIENKSIDYIIPLIFILSIIAPIIIASSQQYITQYGDDIVMISWAKDHSIFDIFTSKEGTGYRPMMNLMYIVGYSLWGSEASYYYLFNGIFFASGMVFLYLLGKILHSKLAGIISVCLYLFLDASFILVEKINFIVTTAEIFFITSAIYYSVKYINTKNINSGRIAIILSVLSFLTKEVSIIIIPSVILIYLYLKKELKLKYIILCIIPFLYLFLEMFIISPEIGGGTNVWQRIITNLQFYITANIETQFKSPILLGISLLIALYYILHNILKKEIILCVVLFIAGLLPFLLTSQPVQHTYLAEANIGIVLLIGIIISQTYKIYDKIEPMISILLIIGILFQLTFIPMQTMGMQNYNRMISDNQNTFYETILEVENIPENEPIFYFSDSVRQKYGGYQITEEFFRKYLYIVDIKNNVTTNYNESEYIILPSLLDIQIFQKEYPNEKNLIVIKQIQHGNNYGLILKKD